MRVDDRRFKKTNLLAAEAQVIHKVKPIRDQSNPSQLYSSSKRPLHWNALVEVQAQESTLS
jgi:hypothetical protein